MTEKILQKKLAAISTAQKRFDWEQVANEVEADLEFVDNIVEKEFRNEYPEDRRIAYRLILEFVLQLSFKELTEEQP